MKLVDRGIMVDGETAPYSPNSTGNNKKRAILEDAMAAVNRRHRTENGSPETCARQWSVSWKL